MTAVGRVILDAGPPARDQSFIKVILTAVDRVLLVAGLSARTIWKNVQEYASRIKTKVQQYYAPIPQGKVDCPPGWEILVPVSNDLPDQYIDISATRQFLVCAPSLEQDAQDARFEPCSNKWRFRRMIRRIGKKKRSLSSLAERTSVASSVVRGAGGEKMAATELPSWEERVDAFISSHDPSRIVEALYHAVPQVHEGNDDSQVSWPVGRAHDDEVCRKLLLSPLQQCMNVQINSSLSAPPPWIQRLRAFVQTVDSRECYSMFSKEPPLILDSGASVCITPCRSDFITYQKSTLKIKDLSSSNKVAGEGMVKWSVTDDNGDVITLELPGYHIPKAEVRLLSPQVLFALVGGGASLDSRGVRLDLPQGTIAAKYCPRSRLPILPLTQATVAKGFWADAFAYSSSQLTDIAQTKLWSPTNQNLSESQKEMLLWHQRLSHASMPWIQQLMRDRKWLQSNVTELHQGPFIPFKSKRGDKTNISCIKCSACIMAKAHIRTPSATTSARRESPLSEDEFRLRLESKKHMKSLKSGHTRRGDCISCDHYISAVPGRLPTTYGKEKNGYTCGTIMVDHASGKIFNFCQLTTAASETLQSKQMLESEAKREGFKIKAYHSDNGTFKAKAFQADCDRKSQTYSYSGTGAHHQNGVAERSIRTVASWARANMLHAALHWPKAAHVRYWPMAIDYAIWVYNRLPSLSSGVTPNEVWSQTRCGHEDFGRTHVFGCPVYVLEPKLQDGKKIPKWAPRARLGMFLGYSSRHSSLAPLILNIRTGKISPQYHVIFDDKFETVSSLESIDQVNARWKDLFKLNREFYLDEEYDSQGNVITSHYPSLEKDWLDPEDALSDEQVRTSEVPGGAVHPPINAPVDVRTDKRVQFDVGDSAPSVSETNSPLHEPEADEASGGAGTPGGATSPGGALAPGGADNPNVSEDYVPPFLRPRRNAGSYRDGPAIDRKFPTQDSKWEVRVNNVFSECDSPVASVGNRGSTPSAYHAAQKVSKAYLADRPVHQDRWDFVNSSCDWSAYVTCDSWDPSLIDEFDYRVLAARASKYNEDNPSWDMVMGGPFEAEYWKAMEVELDTLYNKLEAWTYVPRTPAMRVLPSIWAFKCKRRPDGEVAKFKARFNGRGDFQKEGIDFFPDDIWAPVCNWATIRTMMVIAAKENLVSAQCDITAAFITPPVPPGKEIYVQQPRGFVGNRDYVLKLKRMLYGLRDSPREFFNHLTERLVRIGMKPSAFDPCLFLSDNVIVLVYVDDLLVYGRTQADIDTFVDRIRQEEILLRKEDTAEGYLGVHIERDGSTTVLKQTGLTRRVVKALGLDNKYSTACSTPAETAALPRDVDGQPASGAINYASVVGMMLYLTGHSRPDCAFAVHQCARYTHEPKRSHEVALKRIGRYLKGTQDKGLILNPSDTYRVDCYPDADFAGLWGREHPQDPHCARSRTGYVITLADCPVLWRSSLQSEIAMSTMEAEYVALSTSCKDLFPVLDLIQELGSFMGLTIEQATNLHVQIHEDNVGALTLGNLEPRRMTPRSKHYAVKYHWFRTHLKPRNIILTKIATHDQLGDLFTKGLGRVAFERLRRRLMVW